jgi:transposase
MPSARWPIWAGVPYSADLTDAQWRLLEPSLGRGGKRGPTPALDRRQVVNAVLYQAKTGCQWRMLPAEFGSWNTIWKTWSRWRDRGVWQQVLDLLRRRIRVAAGREAEPSLLMVDCQVVKGGRCVASFHWAAAGSPLLERPKPRLRRRKNDATPPAQTLAA